MLMLDLCCGLKGASAAMKDRGWQVVTLDIDPRFRPDIVADVRGWSWNGERVELIWASPPCTEFARESMPWSRTGNEPDMSIVLGCQRIIDEARPTFWAIENVRGAVSWLAPYLGRPAFVNFPWFLWGFFPALSIPHIQSNKEKLSSRRKEERARIPYRLSLALALAVENQGLLL